MRHNLDTDIPSKYKNLKYKTIVVYEYNKRFLVVGGGSGSGSSVSMGLHFPQEQLTWITPIFMRLLSSLPRFRAVVIVLLSKQEIWPRQ